MPWQFYHVQEIKAKAKKVAIASHVETLVSRATSDYTGQTAAVA
jgi:hypothetical protein